jgi:ATP-dependent Clp protease ATP-binding subunit ClpC
VSGARPAAERWSVIPRPANPEVAVFERFTDTSRRAVAIANQETHRLGGNFIGDVELLIGLAKESNGVCHRALTGIGVDLVDLRRQLEEQPRSLDDGTAPQKLPQTREFKLAIEAAIAISQKSSEAHVGTEHMLLGLLRYPEFVSSRALAERAVSFDRAKEAVAMVRPAGTKGEE